LKGKKAAYRIDVIIGRRARRKKSRGKKTAA
jgi:hypothetical protein